MFSARAERITSVASFPLSSLVLPFLASLFILAWGFQLRVESCSPSSFRSAESLVPVCSQMTSPLEFSIPSLRCSHLADRQ